MTRPAEQPIAVSCAPTPDGFRCEVTVGDDRGATHHVVTLSRADLAALGPGGTAAPDAELLVSRSFAFLLAHESRESILRAFALPVIARYFPEYPASIRR